MRISSSKPLRQLDALMLDRIPKDQMALAGDRREAKRCMAHKDRDRNIYVQSEYASVRNAQTQTKTVLTVEPKPGMCQELN